MTRNTETKGKGRYAYLLSDATFKAVICTPENEKLLIEILELLIPEKHIASITFVNKEMHGLVIEEKNVTFDLLCTDKDTGEQFLVEVQNRPKLSFRDRMLFYSTYPIREQMAVKIKKRREEMEEQLKSGIITKRPDPMDYSLKPVYVISMVNFDFEHDNTEALEQEYISRYEIRNGRNGEVMTPALNFVFLEMGRLTLGPEEKGKCKNLLERFIFSMKYMHMLTERPAEFNDPLLVDLYTATELATMTVTTRQQYDNVMTNEIDRMCEVAYALQQERVITARRMLADKMPPELVSKYTGLTEKEILALQ